VFANGTADFEAFDSREHEVKEHEIEFFVAELDDRILSGRDTGHLEPLFFKMVGDQLLNGLFVFYDEYVDGAHNLLRCS
jgi:hypothetical protein